MEKMPVFIKIDEYKDVLTLVQDLQSKSQEAKALLQKIVDLKNSEDTELESWRMGLEDIEAKIQTLTNALQDPKQ
ncbi:MAG: hypothetical protein ACMXYF_02990 [Candidatus Woesearchaeota archaeon]